MDSFLSHFFFSCFSSSTIVYYNDLDQVLLANSTDNGYTNTGYVSAKLQLMTLQYDLFEFLPFGFCGDWITEQNGNNACPGNGTYYFSVPYELPDDNDFRTWFATGWQGTAYLKIFQTRSEDSPLLAHCRLHFRTYVTDNGDFTLPSAAQATLFLFAILGGMISILVCITCRKKKPLADLKQPIMNDDTSTVNFSAYEEEETTIVSQVEEDLDERVKNLSVKMSYLRGHK